MAARCRDVEMGDSLAHEADMEYKEDMDFGPMEADEGAGSSSRGGKPAAADEDMESEEDDEDEDEEDEEDEL